jgi:four helix bundle protein
MKFSFENLEVYYVGLDWVRQADEIIERSKDKISRPLADQLCRAALSIPLNIAEGNGRWHKGDKKNFFWIARGSAFECVPIIEILRLKNLITSEEHEEFHRRLESIGKMLSALIKTHPKE